MASNELQALREVMQKYYAFSDVGHARYQIDMNEVSFEEDTLQFYCKGQSQRLYVQVDHEGVHLAIAGGFRKVGPFGTPIRFDLTTVCEDMKRMIDDHAKNR